MYALGALGAPDTQEQGNVYISQTMTEASIYMFEKQLNDGRVCHSSKNIIKSAYRGLIPNSKVIMMMMLVTFESQMISDIIVIDSVVSENSAT